MTTLNKQNQSFELPLGLKARCMRTYGWSNELADQAWIGYRQFMKLKLQLEDWDAKLLCPPPIVELVWHQHILDVGFYVKACHEYAGRLICHDPDGGFLDSDVRREQIKTTQVALKALFGSDVDNQVWSFDGKEDRVASSKKRKHDAIDTRTSQTHRLAVPARDNSGELITIKVRVDSQLHNIRMGEHQVFRYVEEAYHKMKGAHVGKFRLIRNGVCIDPAQTPKRLGLKKDEVIEILED